MANIDAYVKVLDMEDGKVTRIEYKGETYENVGDDGKLGDIGLRVKAGGASPGLVNVGSYYMTGETPFSRRFGYVAETNEVLWSSEEDVFEYFRKTKAAIDEDTTEFGLGGLAVIADDADEGLLNHGDVVEIIGTGGCYGFRVKRLSDGLTEVFDNDELEEYVPSSKKLNVGDKVALAIPKGEEPTGGFGGVSNGDIGTVVRVPGRLLGLEIDFDGQIGWEGDSDEVILVEDEEGVEETIEEGDVVRVLNERHTGSDNLPGDIGIVESKYLSGFRVIVDSRIEESYANHHVVENLELVAKASDRKDV